MTKEEIKLIMEKIAEAYARAGKELKTAELYQGDTKEVLIDNRTEEEIKQEADRVTKQLLGG